MSTFTNDTHDEVYLPTLGTWLKPGESVDFVADDEEPEPQPVVDLLPASKRAKAEPKTDPAPEPADNPTVPADTQES